MAHLRLPALRFVFACAIFSGIFAAGAPGGAQSAPAPPYGPGSQSASTGSSGVSQIELEAEGWLQGFIRINTTNPPGNELVAARYLADILQKNGVQSEILVARLSASAVPDPTRALLLMGHLDVVGVDKTKWTVDPFAAVTKDGYIYGRGVIDDKGMTLA